MPGGISRVQSTTKESSTKDDDSSARTVPIAYQCDACNLFPITSLRYTLDGEDIDLCKKCYESGSYYALENGIHSNEPVKIMDNVLRLGKNNSELSCSQILQMHPVAVESAIVEQVEQARRTLVGSDTTSSVAAAAPAKESSTSEPMEVDGDDTNLNRFSTSLESTNQTLPPENADGSMSREILRNGLFDSLLTLTLTENDGVNLLDSLSDETCVLNHLLQLVLHLAITAETAELRCKRGKKIAVALVSKISKLVENYINNDWKEVVAERARVSMIIALRTLLKLFLRRDSSDVKNSDLNIAEGDMELGVVTQSKVRTDPRFICEEHGVPAVRRRCSRSTNKDRRFYVCGMDRKFRCGYFKWADDDDTNKPRSQSETDQCSSKTLTTKPSKKVSYSDTMRSELWKMFSLPISTEVAPLQAQLCELLQSIYLASEASFNSSSEKNSRKRLAHDKPVHSSTQLESMRSEKDALEDWRDGAMLSKEKFGPIPSQKKETCELVSKNISSINFEAQTDDSDFALLQASLDLLSHLATNSLHLAPNSSCTSASTNWSCGWFSLLCEILSSNSNSLCHLCPVAKRMLKRLCGNSSATYHRVRDHYVFASQFKKLLHHSEFVLLAGIEVVERARQCGPNYKTGKEANWGSLRIGGFLGTDGLISEDSLTLTDEENVRLVLDELIAITKTRGDNWRQFCAMTELPHLHSKGKGHSTFLKNMLLHENSVDAPSENSIYNRPPICSLFWLACTLSGSNQVKVLHLIEVALAPSACKSTFTLANSEQKESTNTAEMSTDGGFSDGDGGEKNADYSHFPAPLNVETTPEHLLLSKDGISIDEIHVFVSQFVLRGRTIELRAAASKVAEKIFSNLSSVDMQRGFYILMGPLQEVGFLGIESLQFMQLLQNIVHNFGSLLGPELFKAARVIVDCFSRQMRTIGRDFYAEQTSMIEFESDAGNTVRKWYDLSSCAHCHRIRAGASDCNRSSRTKESGRCASSQLNSMARGPTKHDSGTSPGIASEGRSTSPLEKTVAASKHSIPWLPDQVRPYARSRLESSTERVVSSEFATFVQLKYRLAICEIHLSVTDARSSKLIKTIGIFFSPRQTINLKSDVAWERCGTLSLSRGALRASCVLKTPVIAANLKFEYLEFYEKIGSSRSSDGGLLLSCPRCTRVVNNAHGVCANCGEVVFQCRRCRHINYNVLDAFLCVECGHCASGTFSYELTAGIASNAVAIVDEEGFERAVKLLRIALRRLAETRSILKKKLFSSSKRKLNASSDVDDPYGFDNYNSHLKRALLGELPKSGSKGNGDGSSSGDSRVGKRASAASMCSRPQTSSRIAAASNKARSLLNLARQLRNETEGMMDSDRPGRSDLRQALLNIGSSGNIEFFEDGAVMGESEDLFGVINSSGSGSILHVDMPDPLSRLVANIQARVRSSAMGVGGGNEGDEKRKTSGGFGGGSGDGSGGGGGGGGNDGSSSNKKSLQAQTEECDRLYQQMREAERESFELERAVNAWKRLNRDALCDFGAVPPTSFSSSSFVPSFCSVCAGPVTLHLLLLITGVLRTESTAGEFPVTKGLVQSLFDEPPGIASELYDLKRLAIVTLVEKSEDGAKLVLDELARRLKATRDPASAEILGALLEKKFSLSEEYLKLAVNVLSTV